MFFVEIILWNATTEVIFHFLPRIPLEIASTYVGTEFTSKTIVLKIWWFVLNNKDLRNYFSNYQLAYLEPKLIEGLLKTVEAN